jgi:hypothetical protein
MDRQAFLRYIERFNQADTGAFRENLADDVVMQNGGMFLRGLDAVLEHYEQRIWPWLKETVHAERIALDGNSIAVQMWTHFEAIRKGECAFGLVQPGDQFDFRGVVMYEIGPGGKFGSILVAYLTFTATPLGGSARLLAPPH